MELEFQQLELRYERLRLCRPGREQRLLSSLASRGQQVPIVVVSEALGYVVIDGYKRVRCLRRLKRDTVVATSLELGEVEALVLTQQLRSGESGTTLEHGWLLDELARRFDLRQDELARRFDRSVSWVSRCLGLVRELPDEVQERVRLGEIVAHAAVKYLVPLARAKRSDCEKLVAGIAGAHLSSRDIGLLYTAYRDGTARTRERLLSEPLLFLKALKEVQSEPRQELGLGQRLLNDCEVLGAVARRAHKHLREGAAQRLLPGEGDEIRRCFEQSHREVERLGERLLQEVSDVGRESTQCDPGASSARPGNPSDSADDEGVTQGCSQGTASPIGDGAGGGAVGASATTP